MEKQTFKNTGLSYKEFLTKVADYALLIANNQVDISRFHNITKQSNIKIYNYEGYELFLYIQRLLGDEPPLVLRDSDFDKLNSGIYYRGAAEIDHHSSILCDYDYHHGDGVYGTGIYATNREDRDAYVAADRNKENIMKFKLDENTTLFDYYYLELLADSLNKNEIVTPQEIIDKNYMAYQDFLNLSEFFNKKEVDELLSFYRGLDKERQSAFNHLVINNYSTLALLLGGDVVYLKYSATKDLLLILSRKNIVVSESEKKRILSKSLIYNQDGTINLKNKDKYISITLGE